MATITAAAAAKGGQQRSLPLLDDPTPQQLREWVIQRGSPGGGGFEAAALGFSESATAPGAGESAAALGAHESANALGASASTATGPASAEALHTFTLDSSASCCFFHDCTTVTPLAAPVPALVADPSGGPVVVRGSTVLPCPPVDESVQVAASSQVSPSGQLAASCLYRVLSHQTLLSHHYLGHPSLPRLRSMHSRLLVSSLPTSLPSLPRSPAPPCLPCIEGRQRAAPHSNEFPPTTAPPQTLHMDVRGMAPVGGTDQERYFLLDLPVLRLHFDRGGEFSSSLLEEFCRDKGIRQTFTLPASPQQNRICERCIGLVVEFARTSMIHTVTPHFLCPFAVRYAAHQLNLWPRVSEPETSPTGKVGDASVFRVWGALYLVRDAKARKLSSCTLRCVFLGFPTDAPPWQFYHPRSPTAICGWKVEQMNVKMAFLYGVVDEEIYMKQREGYDDGSGRVCRLKKDIYGLKQAPRCWYARMVEALEAMGFKVSGCDESLFTTEGDEEKVFLLVYVDDILLFSLSLETIKEVTKGTISLHYINTTKQPAYFLTKQLAEHQHWSSATLSGMSFN
ncbi:unnamed protein product [Closterium sp. NIES-54]